MAEDQDTVFTRGRQAEIFAPRATKDASSRASPVSGVALRFAESRSVSPRNVEEVSSIDGELHRTNVSQLDGSAMKLDKLSGPNNDLATATSQNPTIVLELDMDCNVKYISKRWESIVGTKINKILRKPINNVIVGNEEDKNIFNKAVSIMMTDDDSYRVKFVVQTNTVNLEKSESVSAGQMTQNLMDKEDEPHDDSVNISELSLDHNTEEEDDEAEDEITSIRSSTSTLSTDGGLIELEAQGILIHDKHTREAVHSMWIVKPAFAPKELILELPDELVLNLGFGINLFESYLMSLTEAGVTDENNIPKPPQELCRICEQHVPDWWLEKHSELCLVEHRIEDLATANQDNLAEHKKVIQNLLDSLSRKSSVTSMQSNQSGSSSTSNSLSSTSTSSTTTIEYKGFPLPVNSPLDSPIGRRKNSAPSILTAKRFPIKNLDILLQYCDEALKVKPGEIKNPVPDENDVYTISYSPNSEKAMQNLSIIQIPETSDPTIKLISEDTKALVWAKMDSIARYADILQYFDKITKETDAMVLSMVKETIKKINEQMMMISDIEELEDTNSVSMQSPKPMRSGEHSSSLIFDQAYLETNALAPLSREHLLLHNNSEGSSPRSSTPKSIGRLTPILHVTHHDINLSDGERSVKSSSTKSTAVSTPRRPLSPSMSSIQKNVKSNSISAATKLQSSNSGNLTPMSSPLLLSTEAHPNLNNLDKNQLSPLLVPSVTKPSLPSLKDYEVIKPISKGAFGSVYLTRRKLTGEYFAMKILKKSDMIAKNQITNVKAERAIMMAQSNSPYVVQLFATFQSTNYLYLVMEYLNGGDCATLLKNMGSLPDIWVQRYIAEIVVEVTDLHSRGIIHRDLKPDNLLIDQNGHLKLTDFGLSRMGLIRRQNAVSSLTRSHEHKNSAGSITPLLNSLSITGDNIKSRSNSTSEDPFTASSSISNKNNNAPIGTPQAQITSSNPQNRRLLNITPFSLTPTSPVVTPFSASQPSNFDFDELDLPGPPEKIHSLSLSHQSSIPSLAYTSQVNNKTIRSLSNNSNSLPNSPLLRPILPRTSSQTSFVFHEESPASEITNYALFNPSVDAEQAHEQEQQRRFVGTPDYLAPETVAGIAQDEVSDWWSVGCMLFEFLFGYTPFGGQTPEEVFDNILTGEIQWPDLPEEEFKECCSDSAKDLILRLLVKDPSQRLGINGSEDIMEHPYFDGIDWGTLFDQEAAFIPTLDHPESTDYFDDRGADMSTFPQDETDAQKESVFDNALFEDDDEDRDSSRATSNTNTNDYYEDEVARQGDDERDVNDSEEKISVTTLPKFHRIYQNDHSLNRSDSSSSSATNDSSNGPHFFNNNLLNKGKSGSVSGSSTPIHNKKERRASKLAIETSSEFGSFNFRNLAALDKQNKDAINRLKNEHFEHRNSMSSNSSASDYFLMNNNNTGGSFNQSITPSSGMSFSSNMNFNSSSGSGTPGSTMSTTRSRGLSIGTPNIHPMGKPLSPVIPSVSNSMSSAVSSSKHQGRFGSIDLNDELSFQNSSLSPGLQMSRSGSNSGTSSVTGTASGNASRSGTSIGTGSGMASAVVTAMGSPLLAGQGGPQAKSQLTSSNNSSSSTNIGSTELGSPVVKFFGRATVNRATSNDFVPSSPSDSEDLGNTGNNGFSLGGTPKNTSIAGGSMNNSPNLLSPLGNTSNKEAALFRINQRRSSRRLLHRSSSSSASESKRRGSDYSSLLKLSASNKDDTGTDTTGTFDDEMSSKTHIDLDILLCEPIPIMRYSFTKDLESLGCEVVAVSNATELVKRCTGDVKFDMIVTCLELNVLDSFDVIKLIKHTHEINSDTFVVGMTLSYKESMELNKKNGDVFDVILEYPITLEKLSDCLQEFKKLQLQFVDEEAIITDNEE